MRQGKGRFGIDSIRIKEDRKKEYRENKKARKVAHPKVNSKKKETAMVSCPFALWATNQRETKGRWGAGVVGGRNEKQVVEKEGKKKEDMGVRRRKNRGNLKSWMRQTQARSWML